MKYALAGALALSILAGGVATAQSYEQDQYRPVQQDQRYDYGRQNGQGDERRDPRYLGPPERQYEGRGGYDQGDRWRGDDGYRNDYRRHHHHVRRVCHWRYGARVCRWVR